MKILVTGASGFLGAELLKVFSAEYTCLGQGNLNASKPLINTDLSNMGNCKKLIEEHQPDLLIHCAAYRNPDFCELNKAEAKKLNLDSAGVLKETLGTNARMAFISSDYVFSGKNPPYVESDLSDPVNYYGQLKAEAESLMDLERDLIIRFPVLVGRSPSPGYTGYLAGIIDKVLDKTPAVLDNAGQRFPTSIHDIAQALKLLVAKEETGIWHFSAEEGGSFYELCLKAGEKLGENTDHLSPSQSQDEKPATRPLNSQLSPEKIKAAGFAGFKSFLELV